MSLGSVKRKLQNLIARGVVSLVDDAYKRQRMQVHCLSGETFDDVERWQNYGHTSVPPDGAELLLVALGGSRSDLAVICAEDKTVRLTGLKKGDSALYHLEGHFFKLTENGVIEGIGDELNLTVKRVNITAEEEIVFDSPKVRTTGDFESAGTVKGADGIFNGVSSSDHTHNETGTVTRAPNRMSQP